MTNNKLLSTSLCLPLPKLTPLVSPLHLYILNFYFVLVDNVLKNMTMSVTIKVKSSKYWIYFLHLALL